MQQMLHTRTQVLNKTTSQNNGSVLIRSLRGLNKVTTILARKHGNKDDFNLFAFFLGQLYGNYVQARHIIIGSATIYSNKLSSREKH